MGCRRVAPQDELVRVVRREDGTLAVGRALPGRGAWLCAGSAECVDAARRRRAFQRALRGPVDEGAIDSLRANPPERARMEGRVPSPAPGAEVVAPSADVTARVCRED